MVSCSSDGVRCQFPNFRISRYRTTVIDGRSWIDEQCRCVSCGAGWVGRVVDE